MQQHEDIFYLYNQVVSSMSKEEISHFHLKSINNFIKHLDKINGSKLQIDVEQQIREYLLKIKHQKTIAGEDRMDFFNQYIYPIAKIYEDKLHFSVRVKWWIFLGWVLMGNAGVFIIFNSAILYAIFNIVILSYYIRSLIFERKGLVYSFNY